MIFDREAETLPVPQLRALQLARLQDVCARVYERVPHYRAAFEERGLTPASIRSLEDLQRLPFTRKSDLRDNYPFGLFAVPREQVLRIHASSGTTGKPTVVGYTRHDVDVFAEVCARSLAAAGAEPGMTFHNAYGYGLFTGGLGMHYGGERLGLTVVPVSGGMTERQLMLIDDFRPEVIACTPSYALTLAEAFRARGTAPDELSLRYAVLGAEPWTAEMRAGIEEGLGVKAANIYGLSEIIGPGVANEDAQEQAGAYLWEDHFYPEVVDPDTGAPLPDGEYGVLVITTLTKQALPLLRYWTGDITRLIPGEGSTGRTHRRMDMIRGRSDDMLIVRGVNVYPSQLEALLVTVPELSPHYQIVLERSGTLDEVSIRAELTHAAFTALGGDSRGGALPPHPRVAELARKVEKRIRDNVGIGMRVSIEAPGAVPRSEGGKLRRVLDRRRQ